MVRLQRTHWQRFLPYCGCFGHLTLASAGKMLRAALVRWNDAAHALGLCTSRTVDGLRNKQSSYSLRTEHIMRSIIMRRSAKPCMFDLASCWTTVHGGSCARRASITCIVVSAPVIGRVSKVSFERALGTICGGLLGYVAYLVGTNVSQASILSRCAAQDYVPKCRRACNAWRSGHEPGNGGSCVAASPAWPGCDHFGLA